MSTATTKCVPTFAFLKAESGVPTNATPFPPNGQATCKEKSTEDTI